MPPHAVLKVGTVHGRRVDPKQRLQPATQQLLELGPRRLACGRCCVHLDEVAGIEIRYLSDDHRHGVFCVELVGLPVEDASKQRQVSVGADPKRLFAPTLLNVCPHHGLQHLRHVLCAGWVALLPIVELQAAVGPYGVQEAVHGALANVLYRPVQQRHPQDGCIGVSSLDSVLTLQLALSVDAQRLRLGVLCVGCGSAVEHVVRGDVDHPSVVLPAELRDDARAVDIESARQV
mmetsp:Transcript_37659/g.104843  ORF Transcript_37659/g.104843 Transcript_37659/m.104843 type:complete len:233 (+) Transcript_37659:170-868(+)